MTETLAKKPQPSAPTVDSPLVIEAAQLTKRYKIFPKPVGRLIEWLTGGRAKRHTDFWALRDLDLTVRKGECVGIIGPNGAGKSTLLKILSGTVTPTSGTFSVSGRVLSLLELGTGFNPELTGRANILETASLLGYSRDEVHDRIQEIEDFAELGDFFERPLKLYSSGMTVRLAFSMFVSMRPDVLIVDEALAVGDIGFQRRCYQRMEQMLAAGMTCLFVTHDLTAVQRFCHRAVVLHGGCKMYEGAPREACNVLNKIYFGEVAVDDATDYGDGTATIDRIWFEDTDGRAITSSPSHEPLVFCYSVLFHAAVQRPTCGFHIKTVYGVEVALASSDHLGYEFGNFVEGDRLTLRWKLDPHLNPGTYFFGCGCRYSNVERFLSRRVDAVRFPITDKQVMGGIINPFRDLSLEQTRES